MGSALVIVGLALVLGLQIAVHLRLAGIPARIATLKLVAEGRARPEADAFQEALARRLNLILRGIQGYHDQIAEDFRAQVAAGEQRARLAEGQRADAAGVAAELRALVRETAGVAAELRALQGDLVELVCAAAEAKSAPAPASPATSTAVAEDPDERKTVEMPPPASCAPLASHTSSGALGERAERRPQPRLPAATADEGPGDGGWDDPEEKTKLFSKDGAPAAALIAAPQSPKLRVVDGPPSGGSGLRLAARASRHALRPPPPQEEGDDAVERPSILPEARR